MKLHVKLSLSILIALFVIVLFAQYYQYHQANKLISGLSTDMLKTLCERELLAAENTFLSNETAKGLQHEIRRFKID